MSSRNRKKSVAFVIAVFSLVAGACGGDNESTSEEATETTAEATEDTAGGLPGEGILACQVTDTGGVDDKGFNQIAYKGLQDAQAQLGVEIDVLESTTDADYTPNLQNFADKGCDIIITVGFLLTDATREAANSNPDIDYAIVDSAFDPPVQNARGLLFATDESSFLAGYVAAALTKSGIVSTFGGVKIPPVTNFMDGFVNGVAYHNDQKGTKVKVLGWNIETQEGTFTGNFESLDDGKNVAKSQADEGADIIYPVAGPVGIGSAKFAKETGGKVRIIGVDVDMSVSNPDDAEVYLGSALENIDAAVLAAITDTVNGKRTNETYRGTLSNGGVGFAFTDVPADLKAEVEAIAKLIADGKLKSK